MASPLPIYPTDSMPAHTDPRDREIVVLYGDGDDRWKDWFRKALEQIGRLSTLQYDWDTYGAVPISDRAVSAALDLLSYLGPEFEAPEIYPVPDGGLLLQWRGPPEVEIEVGPTERVNAIIGRAYGDPMELEGEPISRLLLDYYEDLRQALR